MANNNLGSFMNNPVVQTTPTQLRAAKEQIAQEQIKEAGANARVSRRQQLLGNTNDFPSSRENVVKYTKEIPKKIVHENRPAPAPANVVAKPTIEEHALCCVKDFDALFNLKKPEFVKIWDRNSLKAAITLLHQTIGCISRQCYSWGWQIFKIKGVSFEDSKQVKTCNIVANYMTPLLRHIILTRTIAGSLQWKLKTMKQYLEGKHHDAPSHNMNITEYYDGSIITATSLIRDLTHIGDLIKKDEDQPCLVRYMNMEEGYAHITKVIGYLRTVVSGLNDHLDKIPLPVLGL